jgi:hypothetical protein
VISTSDAFAAARGLLGGGRFAQGPRLAEILVVHGGAGDGTRRLVASYAARDPRVRALSA